MPFEELKIFEIHRQQHSRPLSVKMVILDHMHRALARDIPIAAEQADSGGPCLTLDFNYEMIAPVEANFIAIRWNELKAAVVMCSEADFTIN